MTKNSLFLAILGFSLVVFSAAHIDARPARHSSRKASQKFTFTDGSGKPQSVNVVDEFQPKKLTLPAPAPAPAAAATGIDPKLPRAASIAQERANAHSRRMCWAYVKD